MRSWHGLAIACTVRQRGSRLPGKRKENSPVAVRFPRQIGTSAIAYKLDGAGFGTESTQQPSSFFWKQHTFPHLAPRSDNFCKQSHGSREGQGDRRFLPRRRLQVLLIKSLFVYYRTCRHRVQPSCWAIPICYILGDRVVIW